MSVIRNRITNGRAELDLLMAIDIDRLLGIYESYGNQISKVFDQSITEKFGLTQEKLINFMFLNIDDILKCPELLSISQDQSTKIFFKHNKDNFEFLRNVFSERSKLYKEIIAAGGQKNFNNLIDSDIEWAIRAGMHPYTNTLLDRNSSIKFIYEDIRRLNYSLLIYAEHGRKALNSEPMEFLSKEFLEGAKSIIISNNLKLNEIRPDFNLDSLNLKFGGIKSFDAPEMFSKTSKDFEYFNSLAHKLVTADSKNNPKFGMESEAMGRFALQRNDAGIIIRKMICDKYIKAIWKYAHPTIASNQGHLPL